VQEPGDYVNFADYARDPDQRRRLAFSYIDARDLGQMVDLCLRKDGLGFQIFNTSANENCVPQPNSELIARYFPGVTPSRPLDEHEGLLSNRKIRDMLGYEERYRWQDQVPK
jgi:nucleoside-diphosphate-sugar epimerase